MTVRDTWRCVCVCVHIEFNQSNPSAWINKVQRLEAHNDDEFNCLQLTPNLIKPPLSGVAPIFWFPNLTFLGVFLWLTKTPKHIGIFPIHILESLPANQPRISLMSRIWWISCFGLGREIRWWGGWIQPTWECWMSWSAICPCSRKKSQRR